MLNRTSIRSYVSEKKYLSNETRKTQIPPHRTDLELAATSRYTGWPGHPSDPTGVNGGDQDCNHAIVRSRRVVAFLIVCSVQMRSFILQTSFSILLPFDQHQQSCRVIWELLIDLLCKSKNLVEYFRLGFISIFLVCEILDFTCIMFTHQLVLCEPISI